jgi:predicted nucleic acid-binding Zn ribbon protein
MDKKYRYGAEKPCALCGTLFRARDADSVSYQSKYCGGACRNKARAKHAERACLVCGKEFKPIRADHQTCGRACGTTYRLSRRTVDPMVDVRRRLAVFCCTLIARCLRNKTDATAEMLGYTVAQLCTHLESHFQPGMTWENYGKREDQWSIDHTRPISTFPLNATVKEINALNNLRPMWHTENCSKKNKWSPSIVQA